MTAKPWKTRLVQDVLPFCTSLVTHGVVIFVVALAVRTVVWRPARAIPQTQTLSPEMGLVSTELPAGARSVFDGSFGSPNEETEAAETPAESARFMSGQTGELAQESGEEAGAAASLNAIGLPKFPSGGDSNIGGRVGTGRVGALSGMPRPAGGGGGGMGGKVFVPGSGVKSVAFVCDASGSMLDKFDALRRQIDQSVARLKPIQSFNIVFFQETNAASLAGGATLVPATAEHKRRAGQFVQDVVPTGATDPLPGLELALRQRPALIFLLTDGDFPNNEAVIEFLRRRNSGARVRINTIAFVQRGDGYEKVLRTIASENGGTFRYVGEEDLR